MGVTASMNNREVLDQASGEPDIAARIPASLSKLSQELLERIWVFVRPSEVIHIVSGYPRGYRVYGGRPPPMLLFNRKYSASALTTFKHAFSSGCQKYPVYVHFKADVFVIKDDLFPYIAPEDLIRIRNLEVLWDSIQIFASIRVNFNFLDFCTGLKLLILLVRYSFMGDTVITNEEPDWAEQITALREDISSDQQAAVEVRRMREGWGIKLMELDAELIRRQQRQPGWVPPRVVLKFEQRRY